MPSFGLCKHSICIYTLRQKTFTHIPPGGRQEAHEIQFVKQTSHKAETCKIFNVPHPNLQKLCTIHKQLPEKTLTGQNAKRFFWTWPAAYMLGSKFQKSEEGRSCTVTKWVLGIESGPLKESSVLNHFLALIELYNSVPTSLTHTSVSNPNKISVVYQVGLWCNCYFVCSGFFFWAE